MNDKLKYLTSFIRVQTNWNVSAHCLCVKEKRTQSLCVFKVTPGIDVHGILQQSIIWWDAGGLHVRKMYYDSLEKVESEIDQPNPAVK